MNKLKYILCVILCFSLAMLTFTGCAKMDYIIGEGVIKSIEEQLQ